MKRRERARRQPEQMAPGNSTDTVGEQVAETDATFFALDEAVARERSRIARELHDGLASDLSTAVALFKYYFESAHDSEESEHVLANVFEVLQTLLDNTRNTLRDMRPRRLGPDGLIAELRAVAEEFGRLYGIRVELWTGGREESVNQAQREVIYHIVRESLANVRRHSGATVCRVRLAFAAHPFMIEVADEGRGFEHSGTSGYGLIGMRERAAGIGARLEVVSTPGRGTTVFLFGPEGPAPAI